MGLILAAIWATYDSGGRRSTNTISSVVLLCPGVWALKFLSKQTVLKPMVCWVIGAFYSPVR